MIEIDDDVLNHLKINAIPYVDVCPNDTLRRLFSLNKDKVDGKDEEPLIDIVNRLIGEVREEEKVKISSGTKRKKVKLDELINAGYIHDGEEFFFVDYGKNIFSESATISRESKGLLYLGETYSMSSLANELLNKHGFSTSATRGPLHWVNANSESIHDLWERYIKNSLNEA